MDVVTVTENGVYVQPALSTLIENNRAMSANSKTKRSDPQDKYIFAPRTARARYVAHTPQPQPHTS